MKRVVLLLLGLILTGWVLIEVPIAKTEPPAAASPWRHTVNGWERNNTWHTGPLVRPARLHPAVVGSFELFVSLYALLAFSSASNREPATELDQSSTSRRPGRRRKTTPRRLRTTARSAR